MLHPLDVVEWRDLHVAEEGNNLEVVEDPIHLLQAETTLLVQLVDVNLIKTWIV